MGFDYGRDASGIVIVTMDMDGQSANTMSPAYYDAMGATVARLEAESDLKGVVFASAKKTFFAGGDLNGLLAAEKGDDACKARLNEEKGYLRRLERLEVPVVAAINGAAVGGGFEICLACTYRVIVDDPAAVVGLPEVTLGLMPGAGGVARLPRMVRLDQALDLLLSGRFVPPAEAHALGLVNRIVAAREDLIPAAIAAITSGEAPSHQPWDYAGHATPDAVISEYHKLIARTRDRVTLETRGKFPAPLRILDTVEQGLVLDIDRTLLVETENFASLLGLPETRAAISLNFFASNAIRTGKMRPKGDRTKAASVAVLGEGALADRVAKAAGRKIDLRRDLNQPVEIALRFGGQDVDETAAIIGSEVATLFADHPQGKGRFGFRVPAQPSGCKLVEIIPGQATANDTLCLAYDLFQRIGFTPVIVTDTPQHFATALQVALLDEALAINAEGLPGARVEALAHDAGFTVALHDLLGDSALRRAMTDASAPMAWSQTATASRDVERDAADRLLYRVSLVGLALLSERVIGTEEEADLGSVLGAGYPPHTGGVIRFARGIGSAAFKARAAELAARYGDRFKMTDSQADVLRGRAKQAA